VIPPNASAAGLTSSTAYKTTRECDEAAIKDIRECYERGQPAPLAPRRLKTPNHRPVADQENLLHWVLNAKQHAREPTRGAGRSSSDDHHTNMAGRGTDTCSVAMWKNWLRRWSRMIPMDAASKVALKLPFQ
jgi:preprotein translocase subunit SecA